MSQNLQNNSSTQQLQSNDDDLTIGTSDPGAMFNSVAMPSKPPPPKKKKKSSEPPKSQLLEDLANIDQMLAGLDPTSPNSDVEMTNVLSKLNKLMSSTLTRLDTLKATEKSLLEEIESTNAEKTSMITKIRDSIQIEAQKQLDAVEDVAIESTMPSNLDSILERYGGSSSDSDSD